MSSAQVNPLEQNLANTVQVNDRALNGFIKAPSLPVRLICEAIGTCCFVFFGAGCATKSGSGLLAISTAHGIVTVWLVYVFGSISGAHFNAAATIAFTINRQMKIVDALLYIIAQALGALLAGALLLLLYYGNDTNLGTPELALLPYPVTVLQGFCLEFICTVILSFVIFFTTSYNTHKEAALPVGLVVFSSFLLASDRDGAALNPWRWLGPAVASNTYSSYAWIYIVGPISGFIVGLIFFRIYKLIWNL
ncbi:unnamed protein product [Rotaria socialis]|uniref:Aquaporin n=1 Tax=Rotaria socialis TaxID=392032 RepID=A0A820PY45_9BILA|nr:unnamed protein product [Rotaria socialis]CAF4412408.1 unnamed protein product [Rotaria socialis]